MSTSEKYREKNRIKLRDNAREYWRANSTELNRINRERAKLRREGKSIQPTLYNKIPKIQKKEWEWWLYH